MNKFICCLIAILVSFAIGCVPKTYRAHPDVDALCEHINNPALLPPDIEIYEVSAGGMRELMDEWTLNGKKNVLESIQDNLGDRLSDDNRTPLLLEKRREEFEDVQALYRAVSMSIRTHTYPGPNMFPEKRKNFDYSIGPIDDLLKEYNADSLIFVQGVDEISTAGRKVLMILATALTRQDYMSAMSGLTALSIALIDSFGKVVWYNVQGNKGEYDLRNSRSSSKVVNNLLADFPL